MDSSRRSPFPWASLAALWCVLAASDLGLGLITPGAAASDAQLPPLARGSAAALELFALALLMISAGVPLVWAFRRLPARRASAGVAAFAVLLLFGASWGAFVGAGQFLDGLGVAMWSANPVQMLQHAAHFDARVVIGLPLLAGIVALVFQLALRTAQVRVGRRARHAGLACVAVAICASGGLGLAGDLHFRHSRDALRDETLDVVSPLASRWRLSRDERAGPAAHALADLRRRWFEARLPTATTPSTPMARPRQIALADWVASVDRDALHEWNVLVLLVESLRPDELRIYGGERDVMPTVDRVARDARIFRDTYTQASHSSYADLCPLSSHYPLRSLTTHFYPEDPSYPRVLVYDLLKQLGWRTAIFSSQNERWQNMLNYLDTGGIDHLLHAETYDGPTYVSRTDRGFAAWVKGEKRAGKIDDRFTVDEAIEWIGDAGQPPFFIYMNLQNSHVPYEVPADFDRPFGPAKIDFRFGMSRFPPDKIEVIRNLYRDSLAYVDAQIARLVDHLERTGEMKRTLLVVTGDTGQAFAEHGAVTHAGPIFDEVMRVPLIVRAPGLKPGGDDRPAQHVDVPPTILELLGLPAHPSFQGVSLLGPERHEDRARYLVAHTPIAEQYGIVRSGYKLIYDQRMNRALLFDVKGDPGETLDLSRQQPEVARRLFGELNAWRRAQIDYYADAHRHTREYPPQLD